MQALIGERMYNQIRNNVDLNLIQQYLGRDMTPFVTVAKEGSPTFCRDKFQSASKPACQSCEQTCRFSIEMILHPSNGLSKEDIITELKHHFHPKTRLFDEIPSGAKRQRNLAEAKRKLADHYIFAHGFIEPEFLT
jgi:hypothetical protein